MHASILTYMHACTHSPKFTRTHIHIRCMSEEVVVEDGDVVGHFFVCVCLSSLPDTLHSSPIPSLSPVFPLPPSPFHPFPLPSLSHPTTEFFTCKSKSSYCVQICSLFFEFQVSLTRAPSKSAMHLIYEPSSSPSLNPLSLLFRNVLSSRVHRCHVQRDARGWLRIWWESGGSTTGVWGRIGACHQRIWWGGSWTQGHGITDGTMWALVGIRRYIFSTSNTYKHIYVYIYSLSVYSVLLSWRLRFCYHTSKIKFPSPPKLSIKNDCLKWPSIYRLELILPPLSPFPPCFYRYRPLERGRGAQRSNARAPPGNGDGCGHGAAALDR